jgi:hypothetical protein
VAQARHARVDGQRCDGCVDSDHAGHVAVPTGAGPGSCRYE